ELTLCLVVALAGILQRSLDRLLQTLLEFQHLLGSEAESLAAVLLHLGNQIGVTRSHSAVGSIVLVEIEDALQSRNVGDPHVAPIRSHNVHASLSVASYLHGSD